MNNVKAMMDKLRNPFLVHNRFATELKKNKCGDVVPVRSRVVSIACAIVTPIKFCYNLRVCNPIDNFSRVDGGKKVVGELYGFLNPNKKQIQYPHIGYFNMIRGFTNGDVIRRLKNIARQKHETITFINNDV